SAGFAQPHKRTRLTSQDEIESSVVIEIGHTELDRLGVCVRRFRDLFGIPVNAMIIRQALDRTSGLDDQEIQNAVVVNVCDIDCERSITRNITLRELSLAFVAEDVQLAGAINQRCVRIAVSVEISPGEINDSGDIVEGMNLEERAVTVVPQDGG